MQDVLKLSRDNPWTMFFAGAWFVLEGLIRVLPDSVPLKATTLILAFVVAVMVIYKLLGARRVGNQIPLTCVLAVFVAFGLAGLMPERADAVRIYVPRSGFFGASMSRGESVGVAPASIERSHLLESTVILEGPIVDTADESSDAIRPADSSVNTVELVSSTLPLTLRSQGLQGLDRSLELPGVVITNHSTHRMSLSVALIVQYALNSRTIRTALKGSWNGVPGQAAAGTAVVDVEANSSIIVDDVVFQLTGSRTSGLQAWDPQDLIDDAILEIDERVSHVQVGADPGLGYPPERQLPILPIGRLSP